MPGVGFEPTSPNGPQVLSLLRMPFRHPGTNYYFLQTSDKVPAGFAPANNGFADRRVSCFTTAPSYFSFSFDSSERFLYRLATQLFFVNGKTDSGNRAHAQYPVEPLLNMIDIFCQ